MPLEGGHWERQRTPLRRVSRRERRVLAIALAALLALSVAIAVGAARSGPTPHSAHGCVELVAASTTGGATYRACGAAAAQWCREAGAGGSAARRTLRARCAEAGLAVGARRPPR